MSGEVFSLMITQVEVKRHDIRHTNLIAELVDADCFNAAILWGGYYQEEEKKSPQKSSISEPFFLHLPHIVCIWVSGVSDKQDASGVTEETVIIAQDAAATEPPHRPPRPLTS